MNLHLGCDHKFFLMVGLSIFFKVLYTCLPLNDQAVHHNYYFVTYSQLFKQLTVDGQSGGSLDASNLVDGFTAVLVSVRSGRVQYDQGGATVFTRDLVMFACLQLLAVLVPLHGGSGVSHVDTAGETGLLWRYDG